jgi:hypothetical protein
MNWFLEDENLSKQGDNLVNRTEEGYLPVPQDKGIR